MVTPGFKTFPVTPKRACFLPIATDKQDLAAVPRIFSLFCSPTSRMPTQAFNKPCVTEGSLLEKEEFVPERQSQPKFITSGLWASFRKVGGKSMNGSMGQLIHYYLTYIWAIKISNYLQTLKVMRKSKSLIYTVLK